MAGRWLQGLPSQKNMLNKEVVNAQNDKSNVLSEKKIFKKYIAAHDTNPLTVIKTCNTTELIRHLEAKHIIDAEKKVSDDAKVNKKRCVATLHIDSTVNKKQKTESMEFNVDSGNKANTKKRKR